MHVAPPGDAVTVYPVIALPPLETGAVQETVTADEPAAPVTLVGAPGADGAVVPGAYVPFVGGPRIAEDVSHDEFVQFANQTRREPVCEINPNTPRVGLDEDAAAATYKTPATSSTTMSFGADE